MLPVFSMASETSGEGKIPARFHGRSDFPAQSGLSRLGQNRRDIQRHITLIEQGILI